MKKLFILLSSVFVLAFSKIQATVNWEIFLNKHSIFKGDDDQENPVAFIKAANIKKNDCISINYYMEHADTGWNRTFYINDSTDQNIRTIRLNKQSGYVTVKASVLKEMMDKKKSVFIYTTSLPKDPSKAALVRIRRVLLCRIEWK